MTVLDPSRLNIHCEDIVDTSFDNQIMAGYFIAREFSYNALARKFGVSKRVIVDIVKRRSYKNVA